MSTAEFGKTPSGLWRSPSTGALRALLTALGRPYWPRTEEEEVLPENARLRAVTPVEDEDKDEDKKFSEAMLSRALEHRQLDEQLPGAILDQTVGVQNESMVHARDRIGRPSQSKEHHVEGAA